MNHFSNALKYCIKNRKFTIVIIAISLANILLTAFLVKGVYAALIALIFSPTLFAVAYSIKNNEKLKNIPLLIVKYLPIYVISIVLPLVTDYTGYLSTISPWLFFAAYFLGYIMILLSSVAVGIYPPLSVTTDRAYLIIFKHPLASALTYLRYSWFYIVIAVLIAMLRTTILAQIAGVLLAPISTLLYLNSAYELTGRFYE